MKRLVVARLLPLGLLPLLALHLATTHFVSSAAAGELPGSVSFRQGPVNQVLIKDGGQAIAVYGWSTDKDATPAAVLLTSSRRDVLRPAIENAQAGAAIIAPAASQYWLESPHEFWQGFKTARFHDYAQRTTKILAKPIPVQRFVKDGETVKLGSIEFHAVATVGFTRDAMTYLAEIDETKIAFTGDLIYGDGQMLDLYSFQDAIPAAQIRGYHGYGSRLAELVESLRKLRDERPDVLVPARGPLITQPQQAIEKLIQRVQALYKNYLSTNALHWYFKEERMRTCGERVLGRGTEIELMPYSKHQPAPNWVFERGTSRLLISDSGNGFLLDCGNTGVIDAIQDLMKKGLVKKVEGIFVTHYHDDHTDAVQTAAEAFACPVYATPEYSDVLENPAAYHLPAMTANPIRPVRAMRNGEKMKWHEFELTFHFFPGQTLYHGALFVKKGKEKPIFFIGDAFAPSGIDDYCVQNRNLVHKDAGYPLCFNKLREVDEDFWLVNEHIPFVFSFTDSEMTYLETRYRQRVDILRDLFPWDDPNYGIDEQWAFFYPYGIDIAANEKAELQVRITNHSPRRRTFQVQPRVLGGLQIDDHEKSIELGPRESGSVAIKVQGGATAADSIVTADIRSEGMHFADWVEAMVSVSGD